jgi:hypothetical protein
LALPEACIEDPEGMAINHRIGAINAAVERFGVKPVELAGSSGPELHRHADPGAAVECYAWRD